MSEQMRACGKRVILNSLMVSSVFPLSGPLCIFKEKARELWNLLLSAAHGRQACLLSGLIKGPNKRADQPPRSAICLAWFLKAANPS